MALLKCQIGFHWRRFLIYAITLINLKLDLSILKFGILFFQLTYNFDPWYIFEGFHNSLSYFFVHHVYINTRLSTLFLKNFGLGYLFRGKESLISRKIITHFEKASKSLNMIYYVLSNNSYFF